MSFGVIALTERRVTKLGPSRGKEAEACLTRAGGIRRLFVVIVTALLLGGAFVPNAFAFKGNVWTWGLNDTGQLGDGTTNPAAKPVNALVTGAPSAIAGGLDHSLAVRGGRVLAWGDDNFGQLGHAAPTTCGPYSSPCSPKPVYVFRGGRVLSGVVAVAGGAQFSLALRSDGTVMAWGANEFGQLGIGTSTGPSTCSGGTTACSVTPVLVSGLSHVKAIAAGGTHALALLDNGTVMAWGANEYGQLGIGTTSGPNTCNYVVATSCSTTPIAVGSLGRPLHNVQAIAAGDFFSLAIVGSSLTQVDTWGDNEFGQLGNGITTGPGTCYYPSHTVPCGTTPTAIPKLVDVSAIAANGYAHQALAIDVYGDVIAWGDNRFGQVGDGCSTALCPNPRVESGTHGAIAIATSCSGGEAWQVGHNCRSLALLPPCGRVVEWGDGPLGNGTLGGSPTPVTVSGLSTATAIAAGGTHSLALAPPPSVRFQIVCPPRNGGPPKVHIPAPGVLLAVQVPTPLGGRPLIEPLTVHITKAGTVALKLKLTTAGQNALKRTRTVHVNVKFTFTPSGGTPAIRTITVTLRRAPTPSGLSGTWSGRYSGAFTGSFKLTWRQSGSKLSGIIKLSNPPSILSIHGSVSGNVIRFGTVGSAAITYSGTVSGNSMSGHFSTPRGGGSWSAAKAS